MTPTLREARLQAGFDLQDVATKTGLSVTQIEHYEVDSSSIDWQALATLCQMYNTHPNDVWLGVENEKHALSGA